MSHVKIDRVDISVSRLGFGTASLHHQFGAKARREVLKTAIECGITHFDTSPYYGYGLAEHDLGHVLKKRRSSFTITTKFGLYPNGGYSSSSFGLWSRKIAGKILKNNSDPLKIWDIKSAKLSLEASLTRLQCDYIDFLLLHEPIETDINTEEMVAWLEAEKSKGSIRAWGLAGLKESIDPFIGNHSGLDNVIQTKDCVEQHEADFLIQSGRKLQFTYGYLSSSKIRNMHMPFSSILKKAFQRNTEGSIIISSNKPHHILELSKTLDS